MKDEGLNMGLERGWLVGVMVVGAVAALAAAALFWVMLTQPLSASAFVAGGVWL